MADNEKLVDMLKYVLEHNEFYRKRIKKYGVTNPLDITQWPVLTRKELQENRYSMFSDWYKGKYFNRQLIRQSSSGSTGIPINVYWDYKDWYASNMCLWRKRWEWYGIKPSDKYCLFTLNAFGIIPEGTKLYYINDPRNIISFNVSLIKDGSGYERMAMIINDFKPDWLFIQPFVLKQLITAYKNLNLSPSKSIKYIETVGEMLTSDLREKVYELFQLEITNMYGSEEMNGIAIQCPNQHMHILRDNVYIEAGNNSEAIITNLCNHAMPLIRYDQGDNIRTYRLIDSCRYENHNEVLTSIYGRTLDIVSIGNIEIPPNCLLEIMAEVNNQFNNIILSYRFEISKSKKNITCWIELPLFQSGWFSNVQKTVRDVFAKKLGTNDQFTIDVMLNIGNGIDNKKHNYFEIVE